MVFNALIDIFETCSSVMASISSRVGMGGGGGGGADAGVLEGLVRLPLLGIEPRLGVELAVFWRGFDGSLVGVFCGRGAAIGGGVVCGGG
jgi:hypothetical protein